MILNHKHLRISGRKTSNQNCTFKEKFTTEPNDKQGITSFLLFISGLYTFGYDIKAREHLDHWNNSVLLLHPADTFNHSGHVHSWHFYANRTVNVTLQVWRPIVSELHQFRLVGQNFYNISSTGIQNVVVSPSSRIPFEEGDVIGVYFPTLNPIPFSKRTSNCSGPLLYLHMTHPQLRRSYPFREKEDGWNPCRIYSIHLQFSNSSKCYSVELHDKSVK